MNNIILLTIISCLCLTSCFEIVDINIKGNEGQSFPYVEIVYFSKTGWKSLITASKPSNSDKAIDLEVEYVKLFEDGKEVFSNFDITDTANPITYIPIEGKTYSLTVKIIGFDEIQSKSQRFETEVAIDRIEIQDRAATCSWTNTDVHGMYYLIEVDPITYTYPKYRRINFIDNLSNQVPNTMSQGIELDRDTLYVSLHRPSTDLSLFYRSIREFESSFNEGVIDPHLVYSNLSNGFGIFGFNTQSEVKTILRQP